MKRKLKKIYLKSNIRKLAGMITASAGFMALGSHAHAQTVIIQDNFTSGSPGGTELGTETANGAVGLFPSPTNLPGGSYQHITGAYYDSSEASGSPTGGATTPGNFAYFHNDAAVGLTLGAFNTGSLQISGELQYGTINGQTVQAPISPSFSLIGFSSSVSSGSNYGPTSTATFTGLEANFDGSLQEYVDGTAVGGAIAFGGTYDPTTYSTLSYVLDTATGAISGVTFGDSTAVYNFATSGSFLNSDSAYVEIGGSAGRVSAGSEITDLTVETAVPEPSTYALLGGGLATFAFFRRYQRRLS